MQGSNAEASAQKTTKAHLISMMRSPVSIRTLGLVQTTSPYSGLVTVDESPKRKGSWAQSRTGPAQQLV